MENHTLEDGSKIIGMEKERKSGQTEAERLHTILMERKKEQPSITIKMERKKTDFTKMVSYLMILTILKTSKISLKIILSKFVQFSFNLMTGLV